MFSYALKRIIRSWKLFAALLLGMTLATTFFGGINVAADTIGKQFIDQQLANSPVDFTLNPNNFQSAYNPSVLGTLKSKILQIDGVEAAEAAGSANSYTNASLPMIRAVEDDSIVRSHFTPSIPLASGQALFVSGSGYQYKPGDSINYTFQGQRCNPICSAPVYYKMIINIVGVANLDTFAQDVILGYYGARVQYGGPVNYYNPPNLIVSWDHTFFSLVQWAYNSSVRANFNSNMNVYIDRDRLISPWDVSGSVATVKSISDRVANIALQNGFTEQDNITYQLASIGSTIVFLRIPFIIFSIPVFFIAWYVGKTVSQASFNLRRKEIGLLMTKGFSRAQLYRHFLTEALLIGLVSGAMGLALGYFLNPYFISVLNGTYTGSTALTETTAITTALFALFLTLIAIRSPAQQAASMDPAQALREYVYVEDVAPSKRRGPIIAFSLGLYKIILLILGVNFATLSRIGFAGGFFSGLILFVLILLDLGLTFVGPFLFLYGAVNLSSTLALKFHQKFSVISRRIVGDIATLASKSVFRNPRRAVSTVFLVAIIAGYSVWVIGDLASMEDFAARQSLTHVGADVRVSGLTSLSNATAVSNLLGRWSNITATTPEVSTQLSSPGQNQLTLRAIDPSAWGKAAYYEDGWFSGGSVQPLLTQMSVSSQTVILDRGVASYYGIPEDGNLTIQNSLGNNTNLRVIGFFGPDYSGAMTSTISPFGGGYFQPLGWSYVPLGLVTLHPYLFAGNTQYSVLVKADGVSPDKLATSIQNAIPYSSVESGAVGLAAMGLGAIFSGPLNVLRLGTVFAAAMAGIGVGTVAYTGFKEREKETTMISVRGLPYKQLLGLLVTEVLPLVVFALILAGIVGIITVRGDTLALDALFGQDFYTLLSPRRVVFPLSSQLQLGTILALLLLGVFLPAIFSARKNLSRVSRTVRFA